MFCHLVTPTVRPTWPKITVQRFVPTSSWRRCSTAINSPSLTSCKESVRKRTWRVSFDLFACFSWPSPRSPSCRIGSTATSSLISVRTSFTARTSTLWLANCANTSLFGGCLTTPWPGLTPTPKEYQQSKKKIYIKKNSCLQIKMYNETD